MPKKKGLRIEFISKEKLSGKSFNQKFNMIMERVKQKGIVVLEESLSDKEKKDLIEMSMSHISNKFPGIEFAGFDSKPSWFSSIISKITGKDRKEGLVIVGPTDVIADLEQHKDTISFLAKM